MPSINVQIGPMGPVVTVFVSVSVPRQKVYAAEQKALPPPVQGQFLIDSGASSVCIDSSIIARLGLTPTGSVNIHTPSTNGVVHPCNLYDVSLYIPSQSNSAVGYSTRATQVIETNLIQQGISGLIGRDLLDAWMCVYNGPMNLFTICY